MAPPSDRSGHPGFSRLQIGKTDDVDEPLLSIKLKAASSIPVVGYAQAPTTGDHF